MDHLRTLRIIGEKSSRGDSVRSRLNYDLLRRRNGRILKLVFDLDNRSIYFHDDNEELTERHIEEYNIFKTPAGSGKQIYMARAMRDNPEESVFRFFYYGEERYSDAFTYLYRRAKELDKVFKKKCSSEQDSPYVEICSWIDKLVEAGLFKEKKDDEGRSEFYLAEKPLTHTIQSEWRNFSCVVITVRENQQEYVLSSLTSYQKVALDSLGVPLRNNSRINVVCHLCGKKKNFESIVFPRKEVVSFFNQTNVQYAYNLERLRFRDSFWLCRDCREKVLAGSSLVNNHSFLLIRTGKGNKVDLINSILITEGVSPDEADNVLDYGRLGGVLKDLFSVFADRDVVSSQYIGNYTVNFILFSTTKSSVVLRGTIEDVPVIRLVKLGEYLSLLRQHFKQKEVYLNTLSTRINHAETAIHLYRSLLCGHKVRRSLLAEIYASEIYDSYKESNYKDIAALTAESLMFLNLFQEAGCLDVNIFTKTIREGNVLQENKPYREKVELFLDERGFTPQEKCLFYLGQILSRISYEQGERERAFMDSFPFEGLKKERIAEIFAEACDKLRQYGSIDNAKSSIAGFCDYYKISKENWDLSPAEAVIFVMAGYTTFIPNSGAENRVAENREGGNNIDNQQ